MSLKDIISNPKLLDEWIKREKEGYERYCEMHPNSLLPKFKQELVELGFSYEYPNQALSFMPKHKKIIIPIAIKYYQEAKVQNIENEQLFFLGFFQYKGLNELVPMLLKEYHSHEISDHVRWSISDCLYTIRNAQYANEYLDIIQNPIYGSDRQMIVLLIGKLRFENAIPCLIELLEDESVRLHAICALGDFKREEFRPHFERFANDKHPGWRKYAKIALKKLSDN